MWLPRLLFLLAPVAFSQTPSINAGGVVNAATYTAPVAPGSIAAVFGTFAGITPTVAASLPLPTSVAGLSFQFDGAATPLFYGSGLQFNIQVPWELAGKAQSLFTAASNSQNGLPVTVALANYAPGIFAITPSSTNAGFTVIVIYATGLGPVSNTPATGAPSPLSPLAVTNTQPGVTVGGVPAAVSFSGLTPGLVGVYQINATVPAAAPTGNAVPVIISIGGFWSNTVTIAVAPRTSDQRASAMLSQMTPSEKLQLVYGGQTSPNTNVPRGGAGWVPGIPRLGIPTLYLADGSVGVGNGVGPATALPSSIASAAGWDVNQAYKYGHVIGAELRAYGINVNLGGNVNLIGREPRDGRAFETKGEDPILAGKIAAAHIQAIQDQHIIGGIKHFAFNDQETDRGTANVLIDERSARESDLLAFEIGVKDAHVQSVMCAYNLVNTTYSCENSHLLNDVLKGDWAFSGFVMSDWGATHSIAAAANAGLDQEQPDNAWFQSLGSAVQSGTVPQSRVDDMARRILRAMYEVGLFDYPATITPVNIAADFAIAQDAEEQGAVLLKNSNALLPLNPATTGLIAVIGSHADIAILSGGGSAQVTPIGGPALNSGYPCPPCWAPVIWDPSSPMQAIQAIAPHATVIYNDGNDPVTAASLAARADTAIVFVSQWTSEAMDLVDLNFTNQDALVAAVAAANPNNTIVVMENGGAQVTPWLPQVGAVMEAWYPGQMGGPAIANLLFGAVNPSGKLPITFPASVSDLPHPVIAVPPVPLNYSEGMNVGYKWYDSQNITPLFPFGFGLSYTTFAFTNMAVTNNLGLTNNPNVQVTFNLTNTGSVAGAEVAQVYLSLPPGIGEPPKRLVGWQKIALQPGASQQVTIEVDENDSSHPLSYWNVSSGSWQMAPGAYTVYLGNSSSWSALSVAGTLSVKSPNK